MSLQEISPQHRVDPAMAARLPAPGTLVPMSVSFIPSGRAVTYLYPEGDDRNPALWQVDVAEGALPKVIARMAGPHLPDPNCQSIPELRKERLRWLATDPRRAGRSGLDDSKVLSIQGRLYLYQGDERLEPLFEQVDTVLDPQFSCDGSKLAYVRNGSLCVMNLEDRVETRLSPAPIPGVRYGYPEYVAFEELDRPAGYWWSPDGTRIVYQQTDERHIPELVIAHQESFLPFYERYRYPFAGRDNALVRLGLVAAEGGPTRWLEYHHPGEDCYLARVDWRDSHHLLVQILSRDQKRLRLERLNVETGRRELLREEHSETWVNLHSDLRTVPWTDELVWSSEHSGFRHLLLLNRQGRVLRELTKGDWAVDEVVHLDADRREVWFLSNRGEVTERHLERVSLDGGAIERLSPNQGTHRAVVSEDGEHFVLVSSSADQPPVTTLRDRQGRILTTMHDAATCKRLKTLALVKPIFVSFTNRDGVELRGMFYPAQGRGAESRVPWIVFVYGGPRVQCVVNEWGVTVDPVAQMLAGQGFGVWVVDNRGSARRGTAFESAIRDEIGDVEIRDQVDGVRYAMSQWPELDPHRVGILGSSYGGYLVLRAMILAPEIFKAGVARAPVTDWRGYDTAYTERYLGTPTTNPEGYRRASVLERARDLQGRLMIIHGMLDGNVHFRHSTRLASAMIRAGLPFEFLPLPDERHGIRRERNRKYVYERKVTFFRSGLA